MGLIGAGIRGKVDVPPAAQEVNFRRPYVMRVGAGRGRSPDDFLLRRFQVCQVSGLPHGEVLHGGVHVVVPAILVLNPGIGTSGQQWVSEGSGGRSGECRGSQDQRKPKLEEFHGCSVSDYIADEETLTTVVGLRIFCTKPPPGIASQTERIGA